jgi:hypothetical protein
MRVEINVVNPMHSQSPFQKICPFFGAAIRMPLARAGNRFFVRRGWDRTFRDESRGGEPQACARERQAERARGGQHADVVESGTYLYHYIEATEQDFTALKKELWNAAFDDIKDDGFSDLAFAVSQLRRLTHFGYLTETTPERDRKMQEFVAEFAAETAADEIETWLLCGVRLRVCKDMRQKIAKLLWDSRMQNCDLEECIYF